MQSTFIALMLVALVQALPAAADTVLMRNGDRLSGRVVGLDATSLKLRTDYAGEVTLVLEQVAEIVSQDPVTLVLKDDTRIAGILSASAGRLALSRAPGETPMPIAPARVSALEEGVVLAPAWRYDGRVTIGASSSRGNSNVSRANADGEVVARRGRSRVTAGLRGAYARDTGRDTEGNAGANAKYDRFLSERWYAYGNSSLEYDPFRDLRLRATAGLGSGYQVFDTARTTLSLEGGLEYVSTQYYDQPDEDFPAGRAAIRLDHWLWQDVMQLFLRAEGYANLESIERSFVRTQTGLRFPLREKFLAQAQVNVDWQGDPPPGTEAVDRSVILSVGYQW
jgi:putative salt-induced outer membrane protein YdiY